MKIQNQYRYVITDRFGVIDANPLRERDFSIDWEKDDDGKYFYSEQFGGKITFVDMIFRRLKKIERSKYICTEQRMQIFRKCGNAENEIFDGNFKLTDGFWDDDNCLVELKFLKNTPDKCFNKNKTVKVNLLDITARKEVNTTTPGGGVFETVTYSKNGHSDLGDNPYWSPSSDPYALNWQPISHRTIWQSSPSAPSDGVYSTRTTWVREVITMDCGESPAPNWVLIQDNCPTNKKYAKQVSTFDCVYNLNIDEFGYERSFECNYIGSGNGSNTKIENGVLLKDVLELFKNRFCPALTIVSDFFQINPENPSSINYVTEKLSEVNNLMLFQKSDVKRYSSNNNASKGEWTFEKIMECLTFMFNVFYTIDESTWRIEHISYFSRNNGLNLTTNYYKKYVNSLNKYTYDIDTMPRREIWKFKEQIDGGLWGGEIDYENACAMGESNTDKNYLIEELMTDVPYAIANSAPDNKNVSDLGFVMMATRLINGQYYIISESYMNDSLSWSKLIPHYQFHNRPLKTGVVNGVDSTFITTKPTKKGEKISIPLCCDTYFNPNDKITTPLGEGIVEKATFNFGTETLDLDLAYNVFESLSDNIAPVFNGGNITTYRDTDVVFPLDAQDFDGTIVSVSVLRAPMYGTVTILSTTQAKYTPNPGFEGWDFFHLTAKDDWGEDSNVAIFMATTFPPNQPPVAQDDLYIVYKDLPFVVYIGIFENDSDDQGFTLLTPNVVTVQGVPISIDAITGKFAYTSPGDFEGDDSFQYTIVDNAGLTSTATVTLRVIARNKPQTNPDYYSTGKNQTLLVNGSDVGKYSLLANDFTPDGSGGALYCTRGSKPTAQGGTVTINLNGTFLYVPPVDFVGQDSFSYTANNTNGSKDGEAFVSVIPQVFVKLERSDLRQRKKPNQLCDGLFSPAGFEYSCDYTLYFYSNSAGTIPINVDVNWGLKINYRDSYKTDGNPSGSYDSQTSVVSGISRILFNDFIYRDRYIGCGGIGNYETVITTTLLDGGYEIIN